MGGNTGSDTFVGTVSDGIALDDQLDRGNGRPEAGRVALTPLRTPTQSRAHRGWFVRRLLLAADLIGLVAAFFGTELLFAGDRTIDNVGIGVETVVFLASLPVWVLGAKVYGLYDRDAQRADHSTVDELASIFHFVTVVVWLFFAVSWMTGLVDPSQAKLATFWAFALVAVTSLRATARAVARRQESYVQRAVIVGAGDVGQLMGRKILNHPEYGIELVGFVDESPTERRHDLGELSLLGPLSSVPEIVHEHDIERVIIAFSNESHEQLLDLIRSLKDLDVQVDIVPRLFEVVAPQMNINAIESVPIMSLPPLRLSRSSRLVKRTLDVAGAGVALVVLAPLLLLVTLLIKLDSSGPALFTQLRMGLGNRTFRIYKFRTMVDGADAQKAGLAELSKHANGDSRMFKVSGDPRVTRVGRFLRRYSLDELPQLVNVLRGEMSLVGPRPLVLDEDEYVSAWARRRLALRPGMTGLWQVLGRTDIPFEEMVKLDYLYVTNWTVGGDLKILARTIPAVLRPQDAY